MFRIEETMKGEELAGIEVALEKELDGIRAKCIGLCVLELWASQFGMVDG